MVSGYPKQLLRYKTAEETMAGYFVVIDVGQMGPKIEHLVKACNAAVLHGERVSSIEVIDGVRRASASKL